MTGVNIRLYNMYNFIYAVYTIGIFRIRKLYKTSCVKTTIQLLRTYKLLVHEESDETVFQLYLHICIDITSLCGSELKIL